VDAAMETVSVPTRLARTWDAISRELEVLDPTYSAP
jgi:hypothetical protein